MAPEGKDSLSTDFLNYDPRLNNSRVIDRTLAAPTILEESDLLSNKSFDHEQSMDRSITRQRIPDNGEEFSIWSALRAFDAFQDRTDKDLYQSDIPSLLGRGAGSLSYNMKRLYMKKVLH